MHLSTMIDWRHALLGVVLTLACSLAGQSLAALPGFSLIGHLVLALLLGMVIQVCRPVTLAARESTGFIANMRITLIIAVVELCGVRANKDL